MTQMPNIAEYLKQVENDSGVIRHASPEGGLDTVGYGHKLNPVEQKTRQVYGWDIDSLTWPQAEVILGRDVAHAERNLELRLGPKWHSMSARQKSMLIVMDFNLGDVLRKFPRFTDAVLSNDLTGQRNEYKRYYIEDDTGITRELLKRNEAFYSYFLSTEALNRWTSK